MALAAAMHREAVGTNAPIPAEESLADKPVITVYSSNGKNTIAADGNFGARSLGPLRHCARHLIRGWLAHAERSCPLQGRMRTSRHLPTDTRRTCANEMKEGGIHVSYAVVNRGKGSAYWCVRPACGAFSLYRSSASIIASGLQSSRHNVYWHISPGTGILPCAWPPSGPPPVGGQRLRESHHPCNASYTW
jgi:hypothetical protein